jgi:3-deoxy-D-manno-octulosonate 8-phosphate phosphatase (KDO 8-P phosphatase)
MPPARDELERVLAAARLLVLDVDGTLTDGSVVWIGDEQLQRFCVHDGQGLAWLIEHGVHVAWISGRGCEATRRRAQELGVRELHLAAGPKGEVLAGVQERLGVTPAQTIAMGDDVPDLAMAVGSALFVAPADARPELRVRAGLITEARAGHGAVRELCEAMLRARGAWRQIVGEVAD